MVRHAQDTVATEQFAKATSQGWSAVVASDATVPLIEVTVRKGADSGGQKARVTQRARVIFKEDSAAVDAVGGDGLQTRLFAIERAFFNLGGGQTLTASITALGSDSLTLDIGSVQYRLRVDPAGRVLGGRIPAQDVVVERQ